ncbi:GerAB/ArcD/ProY family transporter [Paenibacillus sp. CMAA1364]
MLNIERISYRQLSIVTALYMIGSAILTIPSLIASEAKQDSWLAALIALAAGLLILPIYIYLGKQFSHSTFTAYMEKLLSKWIGKATYLLFIITFPFFTAVLTLRNIGDFITSEVLVNTPSQAIYIFFLLVVIMGVRLGLEPLARTAELLFPFVIFLIFSFVLMITPQFKMENFEPFLEYGMKPVLSGALNFIAYPFLESIIVMLLFPFVKHKEKNGLGLFIGVFIGGSLLAIVSTITILSLGPLSANFSFPTYVVSKNISIGSFLERIEGIAAFTWFMTIFVRLAVLFYICVVSIAHIFNLKEYRFLTLPIAIIMVVLAQVFFPNTAYFYEFTPIWNVHALTMGLLFPLILCGISIIKR